SGLISGQSCAGESARERAARREERNRMFTFKLGHWVLLASGALLLASRADASTIPGIHGSPEDPSFTGCFFHDPAFPARVFLSGCPATNWDMPLPITTAGLKTIQPFLFSGDNVSHLSTVYVAGADGVTLRTSSKTFTTFGPNWLAQP